MKHIMHHVEHHPISAETWLYKFFPFLKILKKYSSEKLKADLIAGLSGAIIVLPQGVAFAIIAGLPPEYGLYSAIVPAILAALFGSSRHLISGPTTALSLVVFSSITKYGGVVGTPEYLKMVLTLTLLAGIMQFVLGVIRMGTLINFVSHSVVVGFTAGAAILIIANQLKNVFEIKLTDANSFVETIVQIFKHLPETNFYALLIALTTLLVAIIIKKCKPNWPGMFIAMLFGGIFSFLLAQLNPAIHIKLLGAIPRHLPPLSLPIFSYDVWKNLIPAAIAAAMLGLVEAVSIARAIAIKSGQKINGNQEFIGQGVSNIVGSFFSSYISSGSFTRSGINFNAGARTQFSAIFSALFLILIIFIIAPITAFLPISSMAGVLLLTAYNLIDFHHIKNIFNVSRNEFFILAITFLATLFIELEFAIYIGIILSLGIYLYRTSSPRIITLVPNKNSDRRQLINIDQNSEKSECPQLKIIRVDGSLFFGAVSNFSNQLEKISRQNFNNLLIISNSINFIDIAAAEMLVHEIEGWRKRKNGEIYICGLKTGALEILKHETYYKYIKENVFYSKTEALKSIYKKLDKNICNTCDARIFLECKKKF